MSDLRDGGSDDDTPAWAPEPTEFDRLIGRKRLKATIRQMMDLKQPGWNRADLKLDMTDGSQVVIPVYPTEDEDELLALDA